jgi:hypothetical protein
VLQQAFLLLCPAPPAVLELDRVFKTTLWLIQLTARSVVSWGWAQQECVAAAEPAVRGTHQLQGCRSSHDACHLGCELTRVVLCCCAVQALLACFLIPLLLQVIREAHKQQGPIAAAALGFGCGLVLLGCDAVSRGLRRQAAAQQAACVTADTLEQCLRGGGCAPIGLCICPSRLLDRAAAGAWIDPAHLD